MSWMQLRNENEVSVTAGDVAFVVAVRADADAHGDVGDVDDDIAVVTVQLYGPSLTNWRRQFVIAENISVL